MLASVPNTGRGKRPSKISKLSYGFRRTATDIFLLGLWVVILVGASQNVWTLILCSIMFLFVLVLHVRNRLVFKIRMRILEECSAKAGEAVVNCDENWQRFYLQYEQLPTYHEMVWQLKYWKYASFAPCRSPWQRESSEVGEVTPNEQSAED